MSDLFGNHIVGFPTRRLMYVVKVNNDEDSALAETRLQTQNRQVRLDIAMI